ncbi:MAG TPA: hypothetical protein VEQ58_05560, partial [Polyangiaceae bacterium]|nr:hypothetical protein [Polyangiaceae bacterium]
AGLGFLALRFSGLTALTVLSLPLGACYGALEVVAYQLVLDSVASSGRQERAWWLLKDSLLWLVPLLAPGLRLALVRGGDVVVCALLLAVALAHAEPALPSPSVGRRRQVLLFVAACLVSFALSLLASSELMLRISSALLAGRGAGLSVAAGVLGQLSLLIGVALGAARQKEIGTLRLVGWILVATAPLVPWATLGDVPALAVLSVASLGIVAAASSLLLLAFLRALPRTLQPLGLAASLCVEPVVEGWAELFEVSLGHPGEVHVAFPLAAVVLLLATGLALLRASQRE